MAGDRENEFCFEIVNDSFANKVFANNGKYKRVIIEISSVKDDELFPDRFKYDTSCE